VLIVPSGFSERVSSAVRIRIRTRLPAFAKQRRYEAMGIEECRERILQKLMKANGKGKETGR